MRSSRKVRWNVEHVGERISTGVNENNPCMNPATLMTPRTCSLDRGKRKFVIFSDFYFPPQRAAGAMCFHLDYQTLISIASFPLRQPIKRPAHCAFLHFYFVSLEIYSFLTRIVHLMCVPFPFTQFEFSVFYCVYESLL
jgi:hypothetical protein